MDAQSYLTSAEEKFKSNDLEQAMILASMARNLDPNSRGLERFVAAYGVHVSASHKISDGKTIDWYGVLGIVDLDADAEFIKKRYKKLSLLVHPDKNASSAAEGAFKLIGEAFKVLSNPANREAYDNIRGRASKSWFVPNSTSYGKGRAPKSASHKEGCASEKGCHACREWHKIVSEENLVLVCGHCGRRFFVRGKKSNSWGAPNSTPDEEDWESDQEECRTCRKWYKRVNKKRSVIVCPDCGRRFVSQRPKKCRGPNGLYFCGGTCEKCVNRFPKGRTINFGKFFGYLIHIF